MGRHSVDKAGGDNGVLPDLLKCCGGALVSYIVMLLRLFGESSVFLLNGVMPTLFLYPTKVIYYYVVTGEVYNYKSFGCNRQVICQSYNWWWRRLPLMLNVALGLEEAVWI